MTFEQIIPLTIPPLADLPRWGTRVEFDDFFVELVPEGQRIFNVRLDKSFATINFGPAEGTSSLAGDRMRRYERRPFEYIVVPPRFPLRGSTDSAPQVLAFVFDFDAFADALANLSGSSEKPVPNVIIGNPSTYTTSLAKNIRSHLLGKNISRKFLEAMCTVLLVEMSASALRPRGSRRRSPLRAEKVSMLLKYIDANLDGDLAIDSLASLVDATPDQLARALKKAVGDSPHNYVLQRRVDTARMLLGDPGMSLAQIAYRTGFSSQSHMTTCFKKVIGMTPGAIRKGS